jgi:signal peptidase I
VKDLGAAGDESAPAGDGPRSEEPRDGGPDEPDEQVDDLAEPGTRGSRTRSLVEWAIVIGVVAVGFLVIRVFLFQAFYIPSESMEPTLEVGDRVLVNKQAYEGPLGHDIRRGDLIVFKKPEGGQDGVEDLIKRVIGLPGETVTVRDNVVYIDGKPLDEPYLPDDAYTDPFAGERVPEGHVFVMGDNRGDSRDSRFFGPIPEGDVVGRAFFRVWPPDDLGFL